MKKVLLSYLQCMSYTTYQQGCIVLVKFLLTEEQTMEQIVEFVVFWDVMTYCIKIKNASTNQIKKLDLE